MTVPRFRASSFAILVSLANFTVYGQDESDFTRAEIEEAWNENFEHHSPRHEEVWQDYLENREVIDREIATGAGNPQVISKAERIALAAIYLEVPEYREFALRVLNLGEYNSREMGDRRQAGSSIPSALIDIGAIDLALELRALLGPKITLVGGLPPRLSEGMAAIGDSRMAQALGDLQGEEEALLKIIGMFEFGGLAQNEGSPAKAVVSTTWSRLAEVQVMQGKFDEASASMDKALGLYGPIQVRGGGAVTIASNQSQSFSRMLSFAETLLKLGRAEEAEKFIREALDLTDRPWIQDGPYFWRAFALAGRVAQDEGDGVEAKAYWEKALEALRRSDKRHGYVKSEIHPDVVAAREGLAWALLLAKDPSASEQALNIAETRARQVDQLFRFASERQRLVYLQSFDPFSLLAETGQVDALADAILRFKGSVLDSILEERRLAVQAESPELREIARELRVAKRLAFEAAWSKSGESKELAQKVEAIEARLGSTAAKAGGSRGALRVGADGIAACLGKNDHLCEFVKYRRLNQEGGTIASYGVMVFSGESEPSWVPLCDAEPAEQRILQLSEAMAQQRGLSDERLSELLSDLYEQLMLPLEGSLPRGARVILSPDGDLSCLSFSVLLDGEQQFAASRWKLSYVSTGRDLLASSTSLEGKPKVGVFADPDFALDPAGYDNERSLEEVMVPFRLGGFELPPLPGTREESERIAESAGRFGWKLESFTGEEAREETLHSFSGNAPDILHFATHGLFLERQPAVEFASRNLGAGQSHSARFDNPLLRALLTLSGAQTSIEKLAEGQQRSDTGGDGLVTAEEISQLDLSETWLAVLSACDTASGETLEGEGVLGLRRGFFLAGVDHLLMTFWPIADEQTVDFIDTFYSRLAELGHPGLALAEVQAKSLESIRQESGLSAAVLFAGPFAVSGSGPLPEQR